MSIGAQSPSYPKDPTQYIRTGSIEDSDPIMVHLIGSKSAMDLNPFASLILD